MADTHPITFHSKNDRTKVAATANFTKSYQRTIGQTSNDMWFNFLITDDTVLKYRTRVAGVWSGWTTVYTASGFTLVDFDIYINSDDNLYLVVSTSVDIKFIKLTHSNGAFTAGTPVVVLTAVNKRGATITKRTDGDFYIIFYDEVTTKTTLFAYESSDDGDSWGDISTTGLSKNVLATRVIPKGDLIWAILKFSNTFTVFEYDTSWDGGSEAAPGISTAANTMGVGKVSDTEIYVVGVDGTGLIIFKYTGTWDSGTYLSTTTTLIFHPGITVVNSAPTCFWFKVDGAPENLYYKTWSGSSWDSAEEIVVSPAMSSPWGLSTPESADKIAVVFNYTPSVGSPTVFIFIQEATPNNEAITFYTKTNADPVVFYAEA